ncbi:MAG: hypothetical protein KKH94_06940 [Candidatus Omnitrophica bacterium]|nr:hypothetical protein [Candidatus Omnitrophota bacterium]
MFDPILVITIFCLYIALLFAIGWITEKNHFLQQILLKNPVVYTLSLSVFLTSWTFFGQVGFAANSGLLYLAFYLGTTITAPFWWIIIRKLIHIKNNYRITSIADFISARYNKSTGIAILVTIIAFVGIAPYIALQLRSIISTFNLITKPTNLYGNSIATYHGLIVVILMIVFTIILGVRRLNPTERHPGIVTAVAFQGIVKLIAFICVGIFVTFFLFDGFGDIFTRLTQSSLHEKSAFIGNGNFSFSIFLTYLIISLTAFLFLPRQFHVTVIENSDENHIRTAMWLVPVYMFIISLFVFPIAMGGLLKGYLPQTADTFVLQLPIDAGQPILALFVFIGGFSAATGMIIISTMTMATMITNHLLLPLISSAGWLQFLRRQLLYCRWGAVALFIMIGYWFEQNIEESYLLAHLGTISFAAILQFAPVIIGGLFWRRGNKVGAYLGLSTGFIAWFYTLLIPVFIRSDWLPRSILSFGPWGLSILRPEHLFNFVMSDPLTHSVFWSLTFNVSLYIIGSLFIKQSKEERNIANNFVDVLETGGYLNYTIKREENIDLTRKMIMVEKLFRQFFSAKNVSEIVKRCMAEAAITDKNKISIIELSNLYNAVEKELTGSLGTAAAHQALKRIVFFSSLEAKELSTVYAEILTDLNISPDEMRRKINYYQEREILLTNQAATLEGLINKRTMQLERAHKELIETEKLATLGKLTATVSHELRNPLGTIRSSIYSIGKRLAGKMEDVNRNIERAERNIERCDLIIDELLEYTKTKDLDLDSTNLDQWLSELLEELRIPAEINFSSQFASNVTLNFDRERMRRCIINCINNASESLRMTPAPEGKVNAATAHDKAITVKTITHNDRVEIKITDNGPGISKEKIDKIFEPLFSTKSFGVGLGLSIVKQIMERHGGGIRIDSLINKYTTATLWLPLPKQD